MATKAEILRGVLVTMSEPYDAGRVVMEANARISQLPIKDRPETKVTRGNVHAFIWTLRAKRKEAATKVRTTNQAAVTAPPQPESAPQQEAFNIAELVNALALLSNCGGSVYRAQQAINGAAKLLKVKEGLTNG